MDKNKERPFFETLKDQYKTGIIAAREVWFYVGKQITHDEYERIVGQQIDGTTEPTPSPSVQQGGEKRTILRGLLFDFLEQGAHYNNDERQCAGTLLQVLQPMCRYFEEYNAAHPGHGKPVTDAFLPPKYDRSVVEMDMNGTPIPPSPLKGEGEEDVQEIIKDRAFLNKRCIELAKKFFASSADIERLKKAYEGLKQDAGFRLEKIFEQSKELVSLREALARVEGERGEMRAMLEKILDSGYVDPESVRNVLAKYPQPKTPTS
jgi:hypothetical protein